MKKILFYVPIVILFSFLVSCKKDNPTQTSKTPICFTVSGFDVSIHNMWKDGAVYTRNVQGLASFNQEISRDSETHKLSWSRIVNNYDSREVTSFNVTIDGKGYSYPENMCNLYMLNEIKFKFNGVEYKYTKSCGNRSHPYGYYAAAYDYEPEQYIITGSKTTDDCDHYSNTISILFRNQNGWHLDVSFHENGKYYVFFAEYDTSKIENRDAIGRQMAASIPEPMTTIYGGVEYTLSDLVFSVERIELPSQKSTNFVTHDTGHLKVSIFENGNIGHLYSNPGGLNYKGDIGEGVSFNGSMNAMFASGFIMGTTSRGTVHGQIGTFGIDYDLLNTLPITAFYSSPPNWDQIAAATFNDDRTATPYKINVKQISYSNTGENGMIIQYRLYSTLSEYTDFYAGIFADWDVGGPENDALKLNLGGYDFPRNMAYQFVKDGVNDANYYGIIALGGMSGARITTQGTSSSIRDSSFVWISTISNEPIVSTGDYRMWIGSGPHSISIGDTLNLAFAIMAGKDLSDLELNADEMIQKYNSSSMSIK